MSSRPTSPIQRAWYKWKALRLPWRKRFLVGLDLSGNTFWEFKDVLSSTPGRMRRIVQYPTSIHHSEVSGGISPAWHQWLRHTRSDPPSLTEQSQDLVRQSNLKILAAEADARWAAKPSFLDAPSRMKGSIPELDIGGGNKGLGNEGLSTKAAIGKAINGPGSEDGRQRRQPAPQNKKIYEDDPWAKSGPSENWQPQAWDPNVGIAKR